ncbi:MAG: hypothetical protein ACYDA9_17270 [Terriglobia bacterium]
MERKSIPASWVEGKTRLLKQKLPRDVQEVPFYPDTYFYVQYYKDALKGLHYMAGVIFSLLHIEPNGCVIDFCEEKEFQGHFSSDTAGLYTKVKEDNGQETEVILINAKHRADPLAVGAILAHEMMHLYLFRLNLKLEDTQENELLTDLATINTGLSILIINGMSYSSEWWLTIIMAVFGRVYWRSQELAFGYFKPREYGDYAKFYFKERRIPVQDVIGYLNPSSRHFICDLPDTLRALFGKARTSNEFIKLLEKKYRKANIIKGGIAAAIVIPILALVLDSEIKKHNLDVRIQNCRSEVLLLSAKIDSESANLKHLDEELAKYKDNRDIDRYNSLVNPYNMLVGDVKREISEYETKRASCNTLIDEYNNQ